MEFTNEFTIPAEADEAFAVLTDLERVAPCMPGATLEEVDGDTHGGRMKVKVGPMSLSYAGTATLTEQDPIARTARIEASGREKRGGGNASADVRVSMENIDGGTRVVVTTDINVTGKPAQFGRGVMADVGAKIIDLFADNLRAELATERAEPEAAAAEEGTAEIPTSAGERRPVVHRPSRNEALDLMEVAGEATAKRLAPLLLTVALLLVLVWRRRKRH